MRIPVSKPISLTEAVRCPARLTATLSHPLYYMHKLKQIKNTASTIALRSNFQSKLGCFCR